MATEPCSPANSRHPGNTLGGGQPLTPGARSNPSRGERSQADSVPSQPSHTPRHSEPPAASLKVVGPED